MKVTSEELKEILDRFDKYNQLVSQVNINTQQIEQIIHQIEKREELNKVDHELLIDIRNNTKNK